MSKWIMAWLVSMVLVMLGCFGWYDYTHRRVEVKPVTHLMQCGSGDVMYVDSVGREYLTGCLDSTEKPPQSHEDQVYAELWSVCKEKHLKYDVWSGYLGTQALAWSDEWSYNQIVLFNIAPYWRVSNDNHDPTAAAQDLIKALNGPPNVNMDVKFDTGEIHP